VLDGRLQRTVDAGDAELKAGVCEVPKGSNRSPRIDKYRPHWRFAELVLEDLRASAQAGHRVSVKAEPWCAWGVTWCWRQGFGYHPLGRQIGGCYALAVEAKRRGLWVELNGKREIDRLVAAYPGAAFVMLDEPLASGQSNGHTGLITGVSPDGWTVATLEGNSGDAWRAGKRVLFDERIRGLVLPLGIEHARGDWARTVIDTVGIEISRETTR
jgi:hypothetical protein